MKFKLIKKIFKKFKIILNINLNSNIIKNEIDFKLKTNFKSILNQSGILDAPIAEEYLNDLLEFFFYDFINILYKKEYHYMKNIDFNIENFKSNFNKNIKEYTNLLRYTYLFEDCIDNLDDLGKMVKLDFLKLNKEKYNLSKFFNDIKYDDNDNYIINEFKYINLQFPLYIYIYKKHFKNLFLIYNLFSSFFLKKLFLSFWRRRKKNYQRYYKFFKNYYIKIFETSHFLRERFFFFEKFDFLLLYTKFFFKLSLLHNFNYIYYNFYNYKNLYVYMICLLGSFLTFYKYPEFKRRKINFRRKIKKNMMIESQYI